MGKWGIVILHFEKLQKTSDTSQEFINTMQCSILSGSMSIHTSRVVIHTKNVNPVTCQIELWGTPKAATKCETRRTALLLTTTHLVWCHAVANQPYS